MKEVKGIVGICRKAGYAIIGGENIKNNSHKMYLILVDKSSGNSLLREMTFTASSRNIPLIKVQNLQEIVGIENCKAVAFKNKALSDEIIEILKGE